jgi:RNA polymerase-binding transcription factor DksA
MAALSHEQMLQLREQLDRREAELLGEVDAVNAQLADAPSKQPHNQVEDNGEQGEQRIREAVVEAEQERDVGELAQIAAAKERMRRGDYGECVDCGIDIPFERLKVQPFAARCIPDQERYEKSHDTAVRIPPLP